MYCVVCSVQLLVWVVVLSVSKVFRAVCGSPVGLYPEEVVQKYCQGSAKVVPGKCKGSVKVVPG